MPQKKQSRRPFDPSAFAAAVSTAVGRECERLAGEQSAARDALVKSVAELVGPIHQKLANLEQRTNALDDQRQHDASALQLRLARDAMRAALLSGPAAASDLTASIAGYLESELQLSAEAARGYATGLVGHLFDVRTQEA